MGKAHRLNLGDVPVVMASVLVFFVSSARVTFGLQYLSCELFPGLGRAGKVGDSNASTKKENKKLKIVYLGRVDNRVPRHCRAPASRRRRSPTARPRPRHPRGPQEERRLAGRLPAGPREGVEGPSSPELLDGLGPGRKHSRETGLKTACRFSLPGRGPPDVLDA